MKLFAKILICAIPMTLIIGCSVKKDVEEQTETTVTELEGIWLSNCYAQDFGLFGILGVITQFDINQNKIDITRKFYSTTDCAEVAQTEESDYEIKIGVAMTTGNGESVKRIDIIGESKTYYAIYQLTDEGMRVHDEDPTKVIDDNGVMRHNELRHDVLLIKQSVID
ncbi:MAG: hypothetical protein OEZ58_14780 [Gammaproteobacteria bacterium]|nr:hypothetical protein [Gammaproteobacteria bacterium]